MQYSTFAAIDIGSYDVILEIFEISKKQGIRSVDKICHRMELGKDTYTLGKIRPEMEEELCRVLADFVADYGRLSRGRLPCSGIQCDQ